MTRPRLLVTRKIPDVVMSRLTQSFEVTFNLDDQPMSAGELADAASQYDALMPTVSDQLTSEILSSPNLRIRMIANFGVGYNNIDIAAAKQAGIAVSNTPDVLTDATADIAMYLILAATRHVYAAEKKLRERRWTGFSIVDGLGASIQGKTLGIIGMGRIGQATARRAALGFDMDVIYFNRSPVAGLDFPAQSEESIEALMQTSDVVSVHVPGGTSPLVTAAHIAQMKPSAYLVNTARGNSIDQDALISALKARGIAGAGLDVFTDEPEVPLALRKMENVTLLPHIGSATSEVRTAMGMLAADNLEAFIAGNDLPNCVVAPGPTRS